MRKLYDFNSNVRANVKTRINITDDDTHNNICLIKKKFLNETIPHLSFSDNAGLSLCTCYMKWTHVLFA